MRGLGCYLFVSVLSVTTECAISHSLMVYQLNILEKFKCTNALIVVTKVFLSLEKCF